MTTLVQHCMRCGLIHARPLGTNETEVDTYLCLRALAAYVDAAIGQAKAQERARLAKLVREAVENPEGDYVGHDERFRADWDRTFSLLADRIERLD